MIADDVTYTSFTTQPLLRFFAMIDKLLCDSAHELSKVSFKLD